MPARSGSSSPLYRRSPRKLKPRSKIAAKRLAAGLTQRQVSEQTGIPLGTYRRYDRGIETDPRLRHLVNLAWLFDCPVPQLFEDEWLEWTVLDDGPEGLPG